MHLHIKLFYMKRQEKPPPTQKKNKKKPQNHEVHEVRHNLHDPSTGFPTPPWQQPQPTSVPSPPPPKEQSSLCWVRAAVLPVLLSEAPTWAQLKHNSHNLKLMLGNRLRKQQMLACLSQRHHRLSTNALLCFVAPALLTAQAVSCLLSLLLQTMSWMSARQRSAAAHHFWLC